MGWTRIEGNVTAGHGVASGQADDPRFPGGTIALQTPFFRHRGLDFSVFHPGTLNVAIAPGRYSVKRARATFRGVKWSPLVPAEDFSFFDCRVVTADGDERQGLIYYPHPETKPEHFQAPDVLEVLTSYIEGLGIGDAVTLIVDDEQMEIQLQ